MSDRRIFCLLPSAFAGLGARVTAAGATAVVDLGSGRAALPPGAWVRVRDVADAPEGAAGILARQGTPRAGTPCWLEIVDAPAAGALDGWAGVVVRGLGSGGWSAELGADALLARLVPGTPVLLDWAAPPDDAPPAGVDLLLSDVLLAVLDLPPRLRGRLERVTAADIRRVAGANLLAAPTAPAVRRLLAGEPLESVAEGLFEEDDAFERAWPAGAGALHAVALARRFGSLEGVVRSYAGHLARPVVEVTAAPTAGTPNVEASGHEAVVHFDVHEPIAIIGLGCRFPGGASSPGALYERILSGFDAIVEVPRTRWDPALFWDPDRSVPDKTYAKIGGFITDFRFDPRRFRIPPAAARLIDPIQQMTLEACADALEDANHGAARAFDRERTAVILGNSMGGEIGDEYTLRVMFPALRKALEEVPNFAALPDAARVAILSAYETGLKKDLPPITEDSMPGELSNVVAGRVANALNLGGPNFTTDAACAGSMAALQAAVKGLQDGDFDLALSGGADRSMAVATYTKFCKIGALSPDGSRPFDAGANGFVMGEGVGIVVLKRLADAERDGDRIYGVIRSVGASSDGKGKGITAPNPEGQRRALRRAYEGAGIDPADVDLFECHGTSTVVGDKVEVEALTEIIGSGRRNARGPARIGSIKSNIGHLKSAAGAASALKAVLALHHKVLLPQINYRNPRPELPLDVAPLKVQTVPEAWESAGPRRAGISSFGFGGTNFHMVLEEHRPGSLRRSPVRRGPRADVSDVSPVPAPSTVPAAASPPSPAARAPVAAVSGQPVPKGIWALSGDTPEELLERCRLLQKGKATPYEPDAPLRVAAAAADDAERLDQLDKVMLALSKGKGYDLLRQRNIHFEDVPCDGQLAFLFTGQGSQYIGMGLDLAEHFDVVRQTFVEADEVMTPLLGRPLTDLIRRDPSMSEEEQFERLRATEISQPATLTVDVALLRLMAAYGVRPDVVAGHSLGEYGAAVAAGILGFRDALVAVSARGREMAAVSIADPGKMAGIATSAEVVAEVLAEIPGYVVPANKNSPNQTVIAGETEAVEAASEAFRSRGITVYPLPVSHAFHSKIVAPASAPLRRVLETLDVRPPRRRITTNIDSRYYPSDADARDKVIDILARQVAAPVEWIAQMERMYADGARIFVECGPKRALAGFTGAILKTRPHRSLHCNQPKRGGVMSFLDALAALFALGFPVDAAPGAGADVFAESGARRSTSPRLAARASNRSGTAPADGGEVRGTDAIERVILKIVGAKTGYPREALDLDYELEADLGIDTVKLAEIIATTWEHFRLDPDPEFRMADHRTLRSLVDYTGKRVGATRPDVVPGRRAAAPAAATAAASVAQPVLPAEAAAKFLAEVAGRDLRGLDASSFAQAMLPALQGFLRSAWEAYRAASPAPSAAGLVASAPAAAALAPTATHPDASAARVRVVCSGASVGLPGGDEVFAFDNIGRILRGENRISPVPVDQQDAQLSRKIVRLVKDARTGQGEFVAVHEREDVIRLAGIGARFDLSDYGIDAEQARTLDVTTQLAFAAGLEALRDAGVPLVRTYRATTAGKNVATGWALPPDWRDDTGIVFASAFPGYDQLLRKLASNGDDGEGRFDRRFLFQVLAMGHSQFAQLVGARGPNTQVNAACASTTQALSIAEDWIRLGRARRVIVLGADDVTNPQLFPWIGTGFLAAGAATTKDVVEEAALPFDRRRHGMILGMGAVGMMVERAEDVAARGMAPIAELLGTRISNSAFHGTRLDAAHISREVSTFAEAVVKVAGVSKETFARSAVFLSHETYTPARGGSAAAEMASLPAAFGPAAKHIVIANTKGFTGHPMGAGVEDAVAVKALQYRMVPPIANLREPDPDLGELTLSEGGSYPVAYALRLAAGFGSQLALAAWKRMADGDARVTQPGVYRSWLARAGGGDGRLVIENRQLRYHVGVSASDAELCLAVGLAGPVERKAPVAAPTAPFMSPSASAPAASAPTAGVSRAAVLEALLAVVAAKTGYSRDEIDPAYELEADLGIDTVKQAEIFGEVREKFGLARDDGFKLADYPTIEKLAGWMAERAGATDAATPVSMSGPPVAPTPAPAAGVSRAAVLDALLEVVAAKTGYSRDEIDPAYELEADLGIDTVKQAEIFGEVREKFGLARDDGFKLADYPTIEKLAGWMAERAASGAPSTDAPAPAPASNTTPAAPVTQPHAAFPVVAPRADDPAAVAPPAVVSRDDVLRALIEVVSQKTGYEPSEIDPAFELEADLGIDTVKQAEIFGEVREKFGLARDDSFRLADYPTIEKLAGWMAERAASGSAGAPMVASTPGVPPTGTHTPSVVSPVSVAPAVPASAETAAAVSREDVLRTLIEVVSQKTGYEPSEIDPKFELEADLGIDTVKQAEIFGEVREKFGLARDDSFKLADYPTIEKLAGWMADRAVDGAAAETAAAAVASAGAVAARDLANLVTSDPTDARDPLHDALQAPEPRNIQRAAAPRAPAEETPVVENRPLPLEVDLGRTSAAELLPSSFRVRRPVWSERALTGAGRLDGAVVRVLGEGELASAVRAAATAAGAVSDGQPTHVVELGLPILDAFAEARRLDVEPPRAWLCVVPVAGSLAGARDGGARAGLAKALGREWGTCRARVLDLVGDMDVAAAAEAVLAELCATDEALEVLRSTKRRAVSMLATEPLPPLGTVDGVPVILLTGGTRGITARTAMAFARSGPCSLVLVGRTPPAAGPLDEEAARRQIRASLEAAGQRATPKKIEDALKPLRTAEEARRTVEALRAAGATVEVLCADLADGVAVRSLVEDVLARHGHVDICVHGAGVEESRLLSDKDVAAFKRVYNGKAEGGLALLESLPIDTFFVSMGSVAGRLGNPGQVDYAAANEAMARACLRRPNALHIAWTAWGDVGMAVRGGMESLLTSRGVELLPADAGSALVRDLVSAGVTGEVLVAGRLGDFSLPAPHPLLDTLELDGDAAVARREMTLESDPWIADHAIDGVPVLPGVIGLEMMVATAIAAWPHGAFAGVEDVRFDAPLKLHRDDPVTIVVRAEPEGEGAVRCSLVSTRRARTGREIRTEHFHARVQLEAMPLLPRLPSAFFPEERLTQEDVYRRFFHGPRFQVIRSVEAVALQGLIAEAAVVHADIAGGLFSAPLVLEAAFQAAGLHRMAIEGLMALPAAIDALELVRPAVDGEPLSVTVHRREALYDIDVDGADGRVLTVRGFKMVDRGPLPPGDRFPEPEGGWPSAGIASASEARSELGGGEIAMLTQRGTTKRQADRLAGQLAARRAVAALAGGRGFEVARRASGEPEVVGVADVHVTISHHDGQAVALAVRGARAGIDVEVVEERHPAFAAEWFTDAERARHADAGALTRAWAVKEAVLKALGTGMALSPRAVEVVSTGAHTHVVLHGDAAARHVALGGAPIRIRVASHAGRVVATAVFAA